MSRFHAAAARRIVVLATIVAAGGTAYGTGDPCDRVRALSNGIQGVEPGLAAPSQPELLNLMLAFETTLSSRQHEALYEAGLRLHCYLGCATYLLSIPSEVPLDSAFIPPFVFARQLRPDEKLDRSVRERPLPDWALDGDTGRVFAIVQFFPGTTRGGSEAMLAGLRAAPYGPASWTVSATAEKLQALAGQAAVRRIQLGPRPARPAGEVDRRLTGTDAAQLDGDRTPPDYAIGGAGVRIGICDTGVDPDHPAFRDVSPSGEVGERRVGGPAAFPTMHGTAVASLAAGAGTAEDMGTAWSMRGHATRASIGAYGNLHGQIVEYWSVIEEDGTHVTNHSYLQACASYDSDAEIIDRLIQGTAIHDVGDDSHAIRARQQVWSAGNNGAWPIYSECGEVGYYSLWASAKNPVVVGSLDTKDSLVSRFSSRGPTVDGRIKPDLVAPGGYDSTGAEWIGIESAWAYTRGYARFWGTSMAAPAVSGAIALLMEAVGPGGPDLSPATYKAILINTAADLTGTTSYSDPDSSGPVVYGEGPDPATGFGLLQTHEALATAKELRWQEAEIGDTCDKIVFCVTVAEDASHLSATLAWDDPAACAEPDESARKLANDLDVELHGPDGRVGKPWVLDLSTMPAKDPPGPIAHDLAYRGINRVDNVERVDVSSPAAGMWTVVVSAHDLPFGTSQRFGLASSAPFTTCRFEDVTAEGASCVEGEPVCERFPDVCDEDFAAVVFPDGRRWRVDPNHILPIDEICLRALDCPDCAGASWKECAPWVLEMRRVPKDAQVVIVDGGNHVVLVDESRSRRRRIPIERRPGSRYFALFVDRSGRGFPQAMAVKLNVRTGE